MPLPSFKTELVLTPHDRLWSVREDLVYEGHTDRFTVPAGFVTDLASVPRALWALLPPHGRYTAAAVLHDWLYAEKPVTRKDADGIFLRVMLSNRTKVFRAMAMYYAVRWFGWRAW